MVRDLQHAAGRAAALKLAETFGLPAFDRGWVWLAGAGPGDAGLATLLGLHAIASADVILYDALVNKDLLKLARPGAEILFAGKRAGQPSFKQSDISQSLVGLARKGFRVLRLKGGDPLVFGRGSEEALALARGGIPFRIVPGVTAGIGGLAYAGIPVTHRDTNHSVTFITGHGAKGSLPDVDWAAVAKASPTLVLYMARSSAGEIAARLIAAGRAGDEPAAIISNASFSEQSVTVTTLAGLGEAAQSCTTPAIIVIGENVRLREGMDWLGAMGGKLLNPDPLDHSHFSKAG
ncbi:MAG: uroporphyrinogen-III C-methyltransferase [Alphaproteobacteria bacterium]|jgi:uroporphyrin-III C-methyltransferase|nr:uroporphyrinogen-III C-methyltransferase [Alphaproteobacteria bacterium]MBN9567934.1 uroporphyrinogen-III C-methyltransferase [Alphaproteobacteria bacterium]MBN9592505.1 uroporphyrinogen-III C-methyltransferase [Alphaproteobacteria bacterium]